ncbi:hypothetical protein DNU06_08985 [Putridiphycobacter roseus]|uniref:Methyltransferase FkbM domain-containing protein n=1 Tax=Putridiphycobacter roseus TaxID=2219161 RepID=A0A2W1ND93_9FLAO|nr:FkbM family methyltransferase [Putridiphycobacter roseus]PZE17395.1 hypothetical protein DNU06_08985 [Putridiphycobacter roseus]
MSKIILNYLRRFPIDYFKNHLIKYVKLPEGDIIYKSYTGLKYKLNLKDHVMKQVYLMGIYEKNTFRQLSKYVKTTDTFVDVGANIGTYTLGLSSLIKKGRIISFEPNPRALVYLEENIKMNQIENITVNAVGLSNKDETLTLYTPHLTGASIHKFKDSDQQETISLTTLDSYCKKNNINNIDILKIDIEGHEFKCLQGAVNIIKKSKNMILIVEIDDNCLKANISKEDLFEFIQNMGFNAYLPKAFPFGLKKIDKLPFDYKDNIIFRKENS